VNGKIYALGGESSGGPVNTAEVYDPSTDIWGTAVPMPSAREALAAAVALDGKIYAMGGNNFIAQNYLLNTVEAYDPSANVWSTVAAMSNSREYMAAAAFNGIIYALGGDSPVTGVAEQFSPPLTLYTFLKN